MSSPLSAIRPKNYREKVFFRKLRTQIDGSTKVEYGLTQIKGVGRRFAQAVVNVANIDPNMRVGVIAEKDLNKLEEIILDPLKYGIPNWMVNRQNDPREGSDNHIIGNKLDITLRRDVDKMKRIRSYKGVRHHYHLKVRGQRTKSTGRHGLVVGVMRSKLKSKKT